MVHTHTHIQQGPSCKLCTLLVCLSGHLMHISNSSEHNLQLVSASHAEPLVRANSAWYTTQLCRPAGLLLNLAILIVHNM
jgi:hypothetical protein